MSVRQERAFDKGISFINIKLVFSMQETLFWSYNRVVHASYLFFYQFFSGVYGGFATHVTIPNTIVKRARDDDTAHSSAGK